MMARYSADADTNQVGAFFDMDRTLLSASSSLLWARYMWARGELPVRDAIRILLLLAWYQLDRLDMVEVTRRLVRELAGQLEEERIAFTRQWFGEHLVHYVAPEGQRRLEAHRRRGHRVALITASPSYTAEALAEYLSLSPTHVLATRFEVEDGAFTGRLVEPMVYGPGKLLTARRYARGQGLDLAKSYFYTDSIADISLLEQVGYPVAVNPDRSLRTLAERRGWTMVRFY
jgi:putative phosphoserine phosphatase/1-acylglycerol-3-phosphate O-acyltransferase